MIDHNLNSLNEAERRILRLLAEGHTIKSAANLLRVTTSAVNERLREARRKTGMGSSREIARELDSQENRDRKTGVEPPSAGLHPSRYSAIPFWRGRRGVIAMSVISLTVFLGGLALFSQSPSAVDEPLLGRPLPNSPTPYQWQTLLRTEHRDVPWAEKAEQVLRELYLRLPLVNAAAERLRIKCGTTVCEVAGLIADFTADGPAESRGNDGAQLVQDLQDTMQDNLLSTGLKSEGAMFAATDTAPQRSAFFLYYTRAES